MLIKHKIRTLIRLIKVSAWKTAAFLRQRKLAVALAVLLVVCISIPLRPIVREALKVRSISTLDKMKKIDFIEISNRARPFDGYTLSYTLKAREYLSGLSASQSVKSYRIWYKSDGLYVTAFVSAPSDYLGTKYPVLIFNKDAGTLPLPLTEMLAKYGYIVLASNYGGTDGNQSRDEYGGTDINDVTKLIDLAEMFEFANGDIYMFGWSRGAVQTYNVLRIDNRIKAAAVGAGPTDISTLYNESGQEQKDYLRNAIGGTPDELPDEYIKRSAIYWANEIETPLLIVHSVFDGTVPFYHSEALHESLKGFNKHAELLAVEDEGSDHDNITFWNNLDYIFEWLGSK